jgi:hypothetical protein
MNTTIKLCFYVWLAISALMVWYTNDWPMAGLISKVWLCTLAFFGGVIGTAKIFHDELTNTEG